MIDDDNDGQMIFGDLGGLKLPDICCTGEKNSEKTSPRKVSPTGDRNWARCVTGLHATSELTAVDLIIHLFCMILVHDLTFQSHCICENEAG